MNNSDAFREWTKALKLAWWVPLLFACAAVGFERDFLVPVCLAFGAMLVATVLLVRLRLSLGRFLALGWIMLASFWSIASAAMIALAREEGILQSLSWGWELWLAVIVLAAIAAIYSRESWNGRLRRLRHELPQTECAKSEVLGALALSGGLAFWRSPAAWTAMAGVAVFSSWMAYRHGADARGLVVLGVGLTTWIFLIASGAGQLSLRHRFADVYAIRLV